MVEFGEEPERRSELPEPVATYEENGKTVKVYAAGAALMALSQRDFRMYPMPIPIGRGTRGV